MQFINHRVLPNPKKDPVTGDKGNKRESMEWKKGD